MNPKLLREIAFFAMCGLIILVMTLAISKTTSAEHLFYVFIPGIIGVWLASKILDT